MFSHLFRHIVEILDMNSPLLYDPFFPFNVTKPWAKGMYDDGKKVRIFHNIKCEIREQKPQNESLA